MAAAVSLVSRLVIRDGADMYLVSNPAPASGDSITWDRPFLIDGVILKKHSLCLEIGIWINGHVYPLESHALTLVSYVLKSTTRADRSRVIYPAQAPLLAQPTTRRLSVGNSIHCCYVAHTRDEITLLEVTSINTRVPYDAISAALSRREEFVLTLNGTIASACRPYRNETLRFSWRLDVLAPLELRWVRSVKFPREDSGYANKYLEYRFAADDIAAHTDCDETQIVCAPTRNVVLILKLTPPTEIELILLKWRSTIEQWAVEPG